MEGEYQHVASTYERPWACGPANTCASVHIHTPKINHVGLSSIRRELSLKQTTHTAVSVFLTRKSPACPALAQLTAGQWKALEAMPLTLSNLSQQ